MKAKYLETAEQIYSYCMKVVKDRKNGEYRCGFRDGQVEALHTLGLISEEQYKVYEELIKSMR